MPDFYYINTNKSELMAMVVFKKFSGTQLTLFPQSILDKIASNHPVRLVNEVVDNLKISYLISKY